MIRLHPMHVAKRQSPAAAPALAQDLQSLIAHTGHARQDLIAALQAVQAHYHYLPEDALELLAASFDISRADITSIATFYNQFRLVPLGRHTIRVCIGTACHVKGANELLEAFRNHLEIPADAVTDADGLFTIEQVACLGCCMLAPAIQIDDLIYGPVAKTDIATILRDFLSSAEKPKPLSRPRDTTGNLPNEIRLCTCSSCRATQADLLRDQLQAYIRLWKLPVRLREVGCTGASHQAPLLEMDTPDGCFRYGRVKPRDIATILTTHFREQAPTSIRIREAVSAMLDRLIDTAYEPPLRFPAALRDQSDGVFGCCQTRLATEHAGELDPLDLDQYRQHGGFEQYTRCLEATSAATHRTGLLQTLTDAGLRGRGGAGFPTAQKWAQVAKQAQNDDAPRYVICNGDEGDPGAFMDRMLLESFPLRVIEGLAIAAWTVGAREAIFFIRHEYPIAVERIRAAIRLCETQGLLQNTPSAANSLEDQRPHFQVIEGAGAFVCGEETSLLAAVEGERGIPRRRPPYPTERGFQGHPTIINNVETLTLIPWILRHGAEAFRAYGTAASPGTKTFALAGRVARGGLIEVPMGMTLREIVMEAGGGISDGHTFKAVQVGGPSGGCIPASLSDTPVDYEALNAAGAMMGSGGMVVLDERDCMVDIACYFLRFTQRESCGHCTPCRVGTRRMLQILERLCQGQALVDDLTQLETLAKMVAENSQCGLGRSAPNPVLTALRYFREEFQAHLKGICPAHKCRALIQYTVTDSCIGCTRCAQQCPVDAIPFTPHMPAKIDQTLCTQCDSCRQACPVDAILISSPREPNP